MLTYCIEFQGPKNRDGYGTKCRNGRSHLAHRIAYADAFFGGDMNLLIASGLCVLHKCDNPSCINVDHLWLGTLPTTQETGKKRAEAINPKEST